MTVEFLILKSLPDRNPTIVKREHQLANATPYLILCQRCSAKIRIWQKFFGISAVSETKKSVSLSNKTLTFMRTSRSFRKNT